MSVRTERVGAMVREALGHQFQRSMPEWLDGFITIAAVKMSPDLRIATVHVSIFRSKTKPEILIKRLNTHAPEVRKRLADDVEMKHLPELRFFLDDTLDTVERIDKLLRSVRAEDEARQAEREARAPRDHSDEDAVGAESAGTTGDGVTGDEATGPQATHVESTASRASDNDAPGAGAVDKEAHGDDATGDEATGDMTARDASRRTVATGDAAAQEPGE